MVDGRKQYSAGSNSVDDPKQKDSEPTMIDVPGKRGADVNLVSKSGTSKTVLSEPI